MNVISRGLLPSLIVTYGIKVIYALIVLLIGLKLIKVLKKPIKKALEKSQVDEAVEKFLCSIFEVLLKVILVTIIISMFGVKMTAFIAVLGAAGFAVGLALQGSLSNFAGGVLILILKPFTVGDYIEAKGYSGTVSEIQIFYTYLMTPDNKSIVIPNGDLSNASVINYSKADTRRVDLAFGVGYDSDIKKVKSILQNVIQEHALIHDEPEPFVRLAEHGDSALVFKVRVWCQSSDYWTVHFDLMEQVKEAFDQEGVNIPYPHMEVVMQKS